MATKSYNRRINLYINGKEVKNDIVSIKKEMFKLVNEQARMTRGSDEYLAHAKKIQALSGILKKHRNDLNQTGQSWLSLKKVANGFNNYFGLITAFVASFTGVILGFRKAADAANQFEERLDNLSALTGLTGKELEWLGQNAKDSSVKITENGVRIKQAATDIVDAYTKVGSKRPELLKNKEALAAVTEDAILLSEAAKTKLEPAVNALTTSLNQFNDPASQSRRHINAIAAGSKVGAADVPYLTVAMEKMGTTFALMGGKVEGAVGIIEAIAPKFAKAELAGNSLDKLMLKMKAKGIGYKDGVFDMNRALEELAARYKKGELASSIFGDEHAKMAEVLVSNRADIIKYTKAVTGSNIAIEQATINTDNNSAKLAQAKNKLSLLTIEIGEKFSPAIVMSTNAFTYFLKALIGSVAWFKTWKGVIIPTVIAIVSYATAIKLATIWQNRNNVASLAGIAVQKIKLLLTEANFAATNLWAAAQMLLTGNIKGATQAMRVFNATIKLNPIGALVAIILAAGAALYYYIKQTNNLSSQTKKLSEDFKALQKINEEFKKEDETLNKLIATYDKLKKKKSLTKDEQLKLNNAIRKIEKIIPGIITDFDDYGNAISINKGKIEEAREAHRLLNMEMQKKVINNLADAMKDDIYETSRLTFNIDRLTKSIKKKVEIGYGESEYALKEKKRRAEEIIQRNELNKEIDAGVLKLKALGLTEQEISEKTGIAMEKLKQKLKPDPSENKGPDLMEMPVISLEDDNWEKELDKMVLKAIEQEEKFAEKLKDIRRKMDLSEMTDDAKEIQQMEWKYQELFASAKEYEIDTTELEKLHKEEREKLEEKHANAKLKAKQEAQKKLEEFYMTAYEKERMDKINQYQKLIKMAEDNGIETTEMYQKLKDELDTIMNGGEQTGFFGMNEDELASFMDKFDEVIAYAESFSSALGGVFDIAANKDQQRLQKEKKLAADRKKILKDQLDKGVIDQETYSKKVEIIDDEIDKKQKEMAIKQAKRDKVKGLLDVGINTAVGIMKAVSASPLTGGMPWTAIIGALGAIEAAAIMSAPLPEFAVGGFTAGARAYIAGEAGTEWIASNKMVNDPTTGPVINQLEMIRKGLAPKSSLASPDFLSMTGMPMFAAGGYSGTPVNNNYYSTSSKSDRVDEMLALMAEQTEETRKLNRFLSDPNNRKAILSYDLLKDAESEMDELRQVGSLG